MAGVAREAGIADFRDVLVSGEKLRDAARVFAMEAHARDQRLHAAQDQPAIEGRENRAAGMLKIADLRDEVRFIFCLLYTSPSPRDCS